MAVQRGDVGFLFGLAGLVLGAGGFWFSFRTEDRVKRLDPILEFDRETIENLVNEKTAMREDLAEANKRISSLRKELTDSMNEVAALRTELAEIRKR